jgi:hypothetical protein
MRVALKTFAVGAVILALALVAAPPHVSREPASSGASYTTPLASISLGELFGDENEPDENEPDEGAPQQAQSSNDESGDEESGDEGSGVPFVIMLGLVVAAGGLVAYIVMRIRRLVLRARAWGRDLWARL